MRNERSEGSPNAYNKVIYTGVTNDLERRQAFKKVLLLRHERIQ
jgi:hypothetical protein